MQFRETLLNLAITLVLVLIVVLAGILLKGARPGPVAAIPVAVAEVAQDADRMIGPVKPVTAEFQIFPRPELVEVQEADTLRIRIGAEEHVFALYYVDALETTMNHPQRVAEQGRYFGSAADRLVTDAGAEAARFVKVLLESRRFQVLTRWERLPNTSRYYALVNVEMDGGQWVYLADLLMQRGLGRLAGLTTELPGDSRDISSYVAELQALARQAREKKAGIWARVTAP